MTTLSLTGRTFTLAAFVVVSAALCATFIFDPSVTHLFPPCPLHALTGLSCPACGATRATHWLLHGDVGRAFGFNAAYVVCLPVVLAWLAWHGLAALGLLRAPPAMRPWLAWSLIGLALAWCVVRNVCGL
jgi:hypothetical protein